MHGGFAAFTNYDDLSFLERLAPATREAFERWNDRSQSLQKTTETALRAAMQSDGDAYYQTLERLHPGRGAAGQRLSTILLSKAAKRIWLHRHPAPSRLSEEDRRWAGHTHPVGLQWGPAFYDRFSEEGANRLWQRFAPVDAAMRADEEQWSPGFQGGPTTYHFNQVPEDFAVGDFVAQWETNRAAN